MLPDSPNPIQYENSGGGLRRLAFLLVILLVVLVLGAKSGALQAAWEALTGNKLEVAGKPVAATHSKLSEHNREWLETQPPQEQMEFLLGAAINHDEGATDVIAQKVDGWRGQLKPTKKWENLQMTALYSNDLRVRAAAIEINLAVNNLWKKDETAESLIQSASMNEGARPWSAWELGMLANRGVEVERIHEWLVSWTHSSDEQTRFWAVEGLAHIGTDDTIKDFLDVLRNEPSAGVRERAGCSLAKSGMMTREQRMKAVPGLLDLADDASLDSTTRTWVYQALREITNENLPNEPGPWHSWYSSHGADRAQQFAQAGESVLGNN